MVVEPIDAVTAERPLAGIQHQVLCQRRRADLELDLEIIRNHLVVLPRFDDVQAGHAEKLPLGRRIADGTHHTARQIVDLKRLLEEVTAVDQSQRFAALQAVQQFGVAAVGRKTPELRRRAVNVAGAERRPVQAASGSANSSCSHWRLAQP